jgi:hypothetical protein
MTMRLRSPAWLHFCLLGALLFGAARLLSRAQPPAPPRAPIVVDEPRITGLAVAYARQTGAPPTRAQLDGLIASTVDDDLLVAEAHVAGLDRGDRSVRLRLVEKMRAVSEDPTLDDDALERAARNLGLDDDLVIRRILASKMRLLLGRDDGAAPPADDELREWLASHRQDWELPPSLSLTQVYVSARVHGSRLWHDGNALSAWLRRHNASPALAATRSDPFVLGATLQARSRADLARQLSGSFADAVMALPVGQWSAPIASPFGLHLVRVDERRPPALPALDAVRRRVRIAVDQARASARLQTGLARLHQVYEVRVDEAAIPAALQRAALAPAQLASFGVAP